MANEERSVHAQKQFLWRLLCGAMVRREVLLSVDLLKWGTENGDCPVLHIFEHAVDSLSMSRAPWDGSINWVVCFT